MELEVPQVTSRRAAGQQRFYRPELDALRFVAFLSVFFFHSAGYFTRGFLEVSVRGAGFYGMCLFFLLSAFLITELLRREQAQIGSIHIRAFYVRRVLRIWPLYFAVLLLGYAAGKIFPPWGFPFSLLLCFFLLSGNWYGASHAIPSPIVVLWSISLEEQFYLLWPSLMSRLFTGKMVKVIFGLIAASMATVFFVVQQPGFMPVVYFNSFVEFQLFALGALLAIRLRGRVPQWRPRVRVCAIATAMACWLGASALANIPSLTGFALRWSMLASFEIAVTGCTLLLLGFLGMPNTWIPRWLAYLGQISYGLYVFHNYALWGTMEMLAPLMRHVPLLSKARIAFLVLTAIALPITFGVAAVSFRFFETPFLRIKKRFSFISSRDS